ncbi:hypothetical protein ERJ75_000841000 [Trypanosoma vivax]|nr:hypothetical protein ERJ75_000841000 [Trypanosoma vivax]
MSEDRHWPAFRFPHPVFRGAASHRRFEQLPCCLFSFLGVRACQHRFSRQFLYLCCAARRLRRPAPRVALGARVAPASCAAFVVFTSSHDPSDTCSFSACQSASLQRATLTAAPVAASTASSAARLARHSTRKSAAVCPFVAPAPPNARAERRAKQPRGDAKLAQHVSYLPASFALCRPAVRPAARPLLPTRASMRPRHASFLQREGPRAALIRAATPRGGCRCSRGERRWPATRLLLPLSAAPLRLVACLPRGSQRRSADRRSAGRRAAARSTSRGDSTATHAVAYEERARSGHKHARRAGNASGWDECGVAPEPA